MWYEESKPKHEVHKHDTGMDKMQDETQSRQSLAVPVASEIPEGQTEKKG